jgi:hypothetical protein
MEVEKIQITARYNCCFIYSFHCIHRYFGITHQAKHHPVCRYSYQHLSVINKATSSYKASKCSLQTLLKTPRSSWQSDGRLQQYSINVTTSQIMPINYLKEGRLEKLNNCYHFKKKKKKKKKKKNLLKYNM